MRVAVFGPTFETHEYTPFAQRVGQLVGANHHTLVTGGCPGPVNEAAHAAFGHGCTEIVAVSHECFFELDRPDQLAWYHRVEIASTLAQRVARMLDQIGLAVAFAGGTGTICELEHVLVDAPFVPIVLVGADWTRLDSVTETLYQRLSERGCYRWFAAENMRYYAPDPIEDLLRA